MDVAFAHPMIGDVIHTEPALRQLAHVTGDRVRYACCGPARDLFAGHPDIELISWLDLRKDTKVLDVMLAHNVAMGSGGHFVDGFFPQLNLIAQGMPWEERRPRFHGPPFDALPLPKRDVVCIAPVSANCTSRLDPKAPPNKMIGLGWWARFVQAMPCPVVQLGASSDPVVDGAVPFFGHGLREAAGLMAQSRLVATIETGLGALAGAVDAPILYLSAAVPFWFVDPGTSGPLDYLLSGIPPAWDLDRAVASALRLMEVA